MAQTNYPLTIDRMSAGMVEFNGNETIVTASTAISEGEENEKFAVTSGLGVFVNADNKVEVPSGDEPLFSGVLVRDVTTQDYSFLFGDDTALRSANQPVSVLLKGTIQVGVEKDDVISAGDDVYVRFKVLPEVVDIAYSADFVSLNSIAVTINSESITPVVFNTDQATTMSDLVTAVETLQSVESAEILAGSSDRTLRITFKERIVFDDTQLFSTVSSVVTLGASQPTVTITQEAEPSKGSVRGFFRNDADTHAIDSEDTCVKIERAKFTGRVQEIDIAQIAEIDLNYGYTEFKA